MDGGLTVHSAAPCSSHRKTGSAADARGVMWPWSVMRPCALATLVGLAASCTRPSVPPGPRQAAIIPASWTAIRPPSPGSAAAHCANHVDTTWRVGLDSDSSHLRAWPDTGDTRPASLAQPDGRLEAVNHGEFGGKLTWRGSDGRDVTLGDETGESLRGVAERHLCPRRSGAYGHR